MTLFRMQDIWTITYSANKRGIEEIVVIDIHNSPNRPWIGSRLAIRAL